MQRLALVLLASVAAGCAASVDVEGAGVPGPSARLDDLSLHVDPRLAPRTEVVAPGQVALVWSFHVHASEELASVGASSFDVDVPGDELAAHLAPSPTPVNVALRRASGDLVEASFVLAVALTPRGPIPAGHAVTPVLAPSLTEPMLEARIDGALASVVVTAAVSPTLSTDSGLWRFGWPVEDALEACLHRNGRVDVDGESPEGAPIHERFTMEPTVSRVTLRALSTDAE